MISDRRHPCGTWDWRDSVVSAHQVPWGLAGLSPFSPPDTKYPGDWRDSGLSGPQVPYGRAGLSPFIPPGTLGIVGTQSFQVPRYPEYWRVAVPLGLQVL